MGTKEAGDCRNPPGSQSNSIASLLVASGTADKSAITAHKLLFYTRAGALIAPTALHCPDQPHLHPSPCSSTQGSYLGSDWATELWFELCWVVCILSMHFPFHESHWTRLQCTQWLLPWLWMCLAAVAPPESDLWFDFKPASSPWILQHPEFSAEPALLGCCGWASGWWDPLLLVSPCKCAGHLECRRFPRSS